MLFTTGLIPSIKLDHILFSLFVVDTGCVSSLAHRPFFIPISQQIGPTFYLRDRAFEKKFGELNRCELGVFDFNVSDSSC